MKTAIELIAEERQRQRAQEGWTDRHDDQHEHGELAVAAASYALMRSGDTRNQSVAREVWPWEMAWFKPSRNPVQTSIRDLVKSGALIVAEIERLQRKLSELKGGAQ